MKKIAIIGTGISGLTCAYHLADKHQLTLFEASDYIGGHTHTVEVQHRGETARIDTGFIVFNERTYPNFIGLMDELNVASQATEMSFSVRNDAMDLEYNGHTIQSLYTQKKNFLRPWFHKMLWDIISFNKDVRKEKYSPGSDTIGEYLERKNFSAIFRDNYLLPMISAIWSMGLEDSYDFPLSFFAKFFDNHGLLNVADRPQWYTIIGGSSSYITPLTQKFRSDIRLNSPVIGVDRLPHGIGVETKESTEIFDEVIFACHGDQALALIKQPTPLEKEILSNFSFADNDVILHTDISLLPKRKGCWASWNYNVLESSQSSTCLTYNMNILQRLQSKNDYLVSLNQEIAREHILGEYSYSHPIYTTEMLTSQDRWNQISGVAGMHFCGAYWFNGFHEDGVSSGLRVCKKLEEKK